MRHRKAVMSNPSAPARAFLVLLFALALAAAWPRVARAEEADQPEAGATETESTADKPSAEGFAPAEQAAAAAGTEHSRTQAMCARLDDLMTKGLSYAERGKTAETRASLHCPPISRATQAAEGARTK
jgi:hypothetical protein